MEWAIPLQTFDTGHLRYGALGRGSKPMIPLSYTDGDFQFTHTTLLLPMLPVKSFDPTSGRLVLSLSGNAGALTKLQGLQDTVLAAVRSHQKVWFPGTKARDSEDLRAGFQTMVDHLSLHLYCPLGAGEVALYSKGEWVRGAAAVAALAPGVLVRFAMKLQGISFHQHSISGVWTGKFRLQHRILAGFVGGSTA